MRGIPTAIATLLDVLFPPRCVACGRAGGVFCARCAASIVPSSLAVCQRCGRAYETPIPLAREHEECALCRGGQAPHALSGIRVATAYEGVVRQALLALKFQGRRQAARPLGLLLADAVRRYELPVEVVVPVPLFQTRQRERGYNQAELLARVCATTLKLPCDGTLLVRTRATTPQVALGRAERRTNVAGAFALATASSVTRLAGKRVLLVDDVTTTGSTLDAAAAALRAADPAAIWGVAVARPDLGTEARLQRSAIARAEGRRGAPATKGNG